MKYRTNTTASAWTDLWVDKFTAELGKTGLAENEIPPHLSILRKYLAANPGNPRAIELAGLKKFLSVNADAARSITLFYELVAQSADHLTLLRATPEKPARKKVAKKKT